MATVKKGMKLVCVPCGREVTITSSGVSRATLWCCGKPMGGNKKKSAPKAKKAAPKKTAKAAKKKK